MDRRDFIKLTAATGTSAALASCGNPETQIIRFLPEEDLVPGVAEWKPTVCPLCRANCGMLVRIMEGEADVVRGGSRGLIKMGVAKKLEGNPADPISQGALCARGQAAIQITYHPDRISQPLKRAGPRGSGQFAAIGWEDALSDLVSRLDQLAAAGDERALVYLTRPRTGARQALVARFLDRFGAPPPLLFELFGDEVLRRANLVSFGREQLPTFDLSRARYVIAFGADFLGTWNSPVSQAAAFGRMRQGRPGVRGKFVQVEPRMSQTGANADEWVPAAPGTEGTLALGLAHVILTARLRPSDAAGRAGSLIDGWASGLASYAPQDVERQTGVGARRIERLARELAEQSPSVAIIGGAPLAHTHGLFQALAVNALNALLGSVDAPGGLSFTPQIGMGAVDPTRAPQSTVRRLAADILAAEESPVQVLLVDDANPVFATPSTWQVREALAKIPFIVSFSSFIDETSAHADLILPDHAFLESWTEARPESGASMAVALLAPPAVRPLHETRATPDVLLEVGRRLKQPLNLPWNTFDEMLQASFAALGPAESADDRWAAARKQGGWWGDVPAGGFQAIPGRRASVVSRSRAVPAVRPVPTVPTAATFDGDAATFPFHFLPYASQVFCDGSVAHLPWLQELPDVVTTAMWSSWVEINPQAAARLQIAEGDIVEVVSAHGALRVPALVSPGIAPDVVAMPAGQGHEMFTRYASGRGANPIAILAPLEESQTGAVAWAATRVRVTRVSGPPKGAGRLILFAGSKTEHVGGRR